MGPVRIKYLGLFWMTRRTYLTFLGIAALFASVMVLLGVVAEVLPSPNRPHDPPLIPNVPWVRWLSEHFYEFIGVCLVAQAIDTFIVLRKFAAKEEEQRRQLDALQEAGDAPRARRDDEEKVRPAAGRRPAVDESDHYHP